MKQKTSKKNGKLSASALLARAATAKSVLDAAKKHLKQIKAEHKLARKSVKQARKASRRARKAAKLAIKEQEAMNGAKRPKKAAPAVAHARHTNGATSKPRNGTSLPSFVPAEPVAAAS
jgi:hypothetical protein